MTPRSDTDVSVVIATFDAAPTLRACLDSVLAQRDVRVEVLISDGGSRDETIAIIDSYGDRVAWKRSEADRGIYDAWNHALEHAAGTWILFLGADDRLANETALAQLVAAADADVDLVCGMARYVHSDGSPGGALGAQWNPRALRWRQAIAHPATLHRRSLFGRFGPFDPDLRIAGDWDFLLRIAPSVRAAWHPEIVSLLGDEGVSLSNHRRVRQENLIVQRRNPHSGPVRARVWWTVLTVAALSRAPRSMRTRLRARS